MYTFGQELTDDIHFLEHMEHGIPVQIYYRGRHADIGFVEGITRDFIRVNRLYYSRTLYLFISRPGY